MNFANMTVEELCELARKEQVQIELKIEPNGYGSDYKTLTIQPWEKYEPICPHGVPIIYAKGEKKDEQQPE